MHFGFFVKSLRRIFYPKVCVLCRLALVRTENHLCIHCLKKLPKTRWVNPVNNPVFNVFRGRVPVVNAGAFLIFRRGGIARQLMHEIKYKDNRDLAYWLGQLYAQEISPLVFPSADVIIPVPLHHRKQKQRGYNQSEAFAQGLGSKLNIPVNTGNLRRLTYTQTQTRKSRWERWRNVEDVFYIENPEALKGLQVMLVDDVVTTGATLEACALSLMNAGVETIGIHVIAFAKE